MTTETRVVVANVGTLATGAISDAPVDGKQYQRKDAGWTTDGVELVDGGVQFDVAAGTPAHQAGRLFYDADSQTLTLFNDQPEVSLQIGRELWVRVHNDTGVQINDGQVCYISGDLAGVPTVGLADATLGPKSLAVIGIATQDIPDGTEGEITVAGSVHDVDTSAYASGAILYLSDTVPGGLTDVAPTSPSWLITLGTVEMSDVAGAVQVHVTLGSNTSDVLKIFNGMVLEATTMDVESVGGVITFSYEREGGGDLSLFFDGRFTIFNSTPAATVVLPEGTDRDFLESFVYIPKSTEVLTAGTAWPTNEQVVRVARVNCQSAASMATDKCMKCHKYQDSLSDSVGEGHIVHVDTWIRLRPATWLDGVDPTTTPVPGVGLDVVNFAVTSGNALQLHEHSFPAIDTALGAPIWVANDFDAANKRITGLEGVTKDSLGGDLHANNTYYSLVIFGVVSEQDDECKLFCNAPSGSYGNSSDALADPLGYDVRTTPAQFIGTAFLIARVVLRYRSAGGGTLTLEATESLRETAGAGGGGGTSTSTGQMVSYTVATLPPVTATPTWIFVTDEAGGVNGLPCFSDSVGGVWRNIFDAVAS